MGRRSTVHLESSRGTGAATDAAGRQIATVRYDLSVTREDIVDSRTGERVEGLTATRGSVHIVQGYLEPGETFTLHLEDGRTLDFFISYAYTASDHVLITGTGGIQPPSSPQE